MLLLVALLPLLIKPAPILQKIEPEKISVAALPGAIQTKGSHVVLRGENFQKGAFVDFGGKWISTVYVSDHELDVPLDWPKLAKAKIKSRTYDEGNREDNQTFELRVINPDKKASKRLKLVVAIFTMGG